MNNSKINLNKRRSSINDFIRFKKASSNNAFNPSNSDYLTMSKRLDKESPAFSTNISAQTELLKDFYNKRQINPGVLTTTDAQVYNTMAKNNNVSLLYSPKIHDIIMASLGFSRPFSYKTPEYVRFYGAPRNINTSKIINYWNMIRNPQNSMAVKFLV